MACIFDHWQPDTSTISTLAAIDPDKPFSDPARTLSTTACRFRRVKKQMVKPDGAWVTINAEATCPSESSFPDGCKIECLGQEYIIATVADVLDVFGSRVQIKLYLQ